MEWIVVWIIILIIAIVSLIACFIKVQKNGNLSFWKLANKHSEWAHDYFMEHPDGWYVIYPVENKNKPTGDWKGPFFLIVPGIGKITIYGKSGIFESQQKHFERLVKGYNLMKDNRDRNTNSPNFRDLYRQYKHKSIGQLVLYYVKNMSFDDMYSEFISLSLPHYMERFVNEMNEYAYSTKFWATDCESIMTLVMLKYEELSGKELSNSGSYNILNGIVLNFAINATNQPEMVKFIKNNK
jgi:hypothetical protein